MPLPGPTPGGSASKKENGVTEIRDIIASAVSTTTYSAHNMKANIRRAESVLKALDTAGYTIVRKAVQNDDPS